MRRKLVQHGEKTLMVSLPAKWVKAQGLKKGDEVVLAPESTAVTISKEELLETIQKIKISIKLESPLQVHIVLSNAYKLGYDEITIDYSGKEQLKLIKKEVDRMIGFEIVSLTPNTCRIKSVIKSTVEEYENIKKRAWFTCKSALETLIEDMKANKFSNYAVMLELYENNIKFTDFCRRLINKHMFLDVKNSCLEYSVLLKLLYMLSLIKEIYAHCNEKNLKPGKDLVAYVENCNAYFRVCYTAYYKKSQDLASQLINDWSVLDKQGQKLLKKHPVPAAKLLELITLCRNYSGHIIAQFYLQEFK